MLFFVSKDPLKLIIPVKIFFVWALDFDIGLFNLNLNFFKGIFYNLKFGCYSGRTEYQTTQTNRARRSVQFERRPSQRYARRQSHVVRERQQRDRPPDDSSSKNVSSTSGVNRHQPPTASLLDVGCGQDLIVLEPNQEQSLPSDASNGLIMGLNNSPQLHARSLRKSPSANHKHPAIIEKELENGGAANLIPEDHRLDELIKNLAKESLTIHLEETNEKEKLETGSLSKMNTLLINIPNNQTIKSSNQGTAKPLPPDQLKCNILKGFWIQIIIFGFQLLSFFFFFLIQLALMRNGRKFH